jgi:hypothetical protein
MVKCFVLGVNRPMATMLEVVSNKIVSTKSADEYCSTKCGLHNASETEKHDQYVTSTCSLDGMSTISNSIVNTRLCIAPPLPKRKLEER